MDNEDIKLLEDNGWIIECHAPFEIRTKDGSFASGSAAYIVLSDLRYEKMDTFNKQDMHDCFNAGVNRGVAIAAILTKRELDEEFPTYNEYMKRYEE